MNRIDKAIAIRIRQGNLPTAYDGWDRADREICGTLVTRPFDYTKRGGLVIFEYEERDE